MKHLQPFALFKSLFKSRSSDTLTPRQEKFLNKYITGSWSLNPATGLVDVQGSFYCFHRGLTSLVGIQFGTVTGNFLCANNLLTNLVGAPQKVGDGFSCQNNFLTTLTGVPQTVTGDLICNDNKLKDLKGAPQKVDGIFSCMTNQLTSLNGAPQTIKGGFWCTENQLKDLVGAPQTVGGDFFCGHNPLTSLAGAPQTVEGSFSCNAFQLNPGQWNLAGWTKVQKCHSEAARELILTLPYLQPQYWLDLHRSDRQKFNALWLQYRRDPEIRSTPLWQQVEQALSGRAQSNLDDLELLKDFT